MVTVPSVEMRMQYISFVSEIWKLVLMVSDLEGCERR
jgi:hypothetical protein